MYIIKYIFYNTRAIYEGSVKNDKKKWFFVRLGRIDIVVIIIII